MTSSAAAVAEMKIQRNPPNRAPRGAGKGMASKELFHHRAGRFLILRFPPINHPATMDARSGVILKSLHPKRGHIHPRNHTHRSGMPVDRKRPIRKGRPTSMIYLPSQVTARRRWMACSMGQIPNTSRRMMRNIRQQIFTIIQLMTPHQ